MVLPLALHSIAYSYSHRRIERHLLSGRLLFRRKDGASWYVVFVEEEGQGLVEYGLILVLIMVVVVAVLTVFGGKVSGMYSSIRLS